MSWFAASTIGFGHPWHSVIETSVTLTPSPTRTSSFALRFSYGWPSQPGQPCRGVRFRR